MTVDARVAALATRWVHLYTRRLPAAVAWERRAELISDLWEERAESRVQGRSPAMTAASMVYRALAGVPADIAWRSGQRSRLVTRELQPLSPRLPGTEGPSGWRRFNMLLRTRRCHACGRRYERQRWYCPTCKTSPTQGIVDRT